MRRGGPCLAGQVGVAAPTTPDPARPALPFPTPIPPYHAPPNPPQPPLLPSLTLPAAQPGLPHTLSYQPQGNILLTFFVAPLFSPPLWQAAAPPLSPADAASPSATHSGVTIATATA